MHGAYRVIKHQESEQSKQKSAPNRVERIDQID